MKLNNQYFCVNQRFNQAGFSLVELMVGLVIGLLATLAIMQMMGTFDSQKRTTTGTEMCIRDSRNVERPFSAAAAHR